jgi:hypothetical protein
VYARGVVSKRSTSEFGIRGRVTVFNNRIFISPTRISYLHVVFLIVVTLVSVFLFLKTDTAGVTKEAEFALAGYGGPQDEISPLEVVVLAERFVTENGYTESPPIGDSSQIVFESMDVLGIDVALKSRRATLEPMAHGFKKGGRSGEGWMVAFRYDGDNPQLVRAVTAFAEYSARYGRAVIIEPNPIRVWIEHQDVGLESFDRMTR